MRIDNVELGEGTLYIDGLEVAVREGMAEGTDLNEIENPGTYIVKTASSCEFTATGNFDPSMIWTYDIIRACPNRRVRHLILTNKKPKVVKKNFRRAIKLLYKEGRK